MKTFSEYHNARELVIAEQEIKEFSQRLESQGYVIENDELRNPGDSSRDHFPTMLNDVLDKKFSAVDKKIFNMIAYNNSGRMNDWWLEFKQDPIEWIMKKKEDWQARGLWNKTADLIQQDAKKIAPYLTKKRNEDHSEMSDDDYKITPSGHLGGKVSVSDSFGRPKEFQEIEDALDYIRKDMEKNHFWPNIWWISDHGNHWMIDLEGNEIKENADDMFVSKQMSAKPLKNKSRLTPSQLIQQYKDRKFYADYVQKFSLADEDEHKRKKIEAGEKYEAKKKGKHLGRPKGATVGGNPRYSGKKGLGSTNQPDNFRTNQDLDESKTMNFFELNKKMNEVKNEGAGAMTIAGLAALGLAFPGWEKDVEKWFKGEPIEAIKQKLEAKKNVDKQIYAKYPKGSKVDKSTVTQIIKMYKNQGVDVDTAVKFISAILEAVPGTDMHIVK